MFKVVLMQLHAYVHDGVLVHANVQHGVATSTH